MVQEAITEIDMDVFSRRIGPYFSWLESRIESGWQQNDSIPKDVLKEVKYLATTMRARFILGVSKADFTKEVQRTLELFELATEAFPAESDEVESKIKHFTKGISEELGSEFLPTDYKTETPKPPMPEPHPFPMPEPEPMPEPDEPEEPDEEKILIKKEVKIEKTIAKKTEKPAVKKEAPIKTEKPIKKEIKIEKPIIKKEVEKPAVKKEMPAIKTENKKPKVQGKSAKKSRRNKFSIIKWVKNTIYGDDL